tara:strand:- start:8040 stop:9644 length:1605 start_codon:yes stop_codon:yes gene_type:complete
MGIKRYTADADTTITNAFKSNLTTRGTGSNMGRADSMAIFSIYAQESSGSTELSRALLNFPITTMYTDRVSGDLPASGSVSFYLRTFNAVTPFTVPRDFVMTISAVSATTWPGNFSWQEGNGIDMEDYTDVTRNGIGANWMNAGSSSTGGLVTWENVGGDYHTDASSSFTAGFSNGTENLEVDISPLVEQWLGSEAGDGGDVGEKKNYGLGVRLSPTYEAYFSSSLGTDSGSVPQNISGARRSYYTKKFFARSSEFFFKRPILEARWNSATKDDRGEFFYSSSLATAQENLNTLYIYNYFRGQLRDIPDIGTSNIFLTTYSGSATNSGPSTQELLLIADGTHVLADAPTAVTGGHVSTGVYSASFALTASASPLQYIFDVWHNSAGTTQYHTGTIQPLVLRIPAGAPSTAFVSSLTNLKSVYRTSETARFRVFTRQKDWHPNIYTRAVATVSPLIVESGSFAVTRIIDDVNAIQFGTGSDLHTQMSFDVSGSYFDLDMGMLKAGYSYKINLAYYNGSIGDWQEQPQEFKFRVEE